MIMITISHVRIHNFCKLYFKQTEILEMGAEQDKKFGCIKIYHILDKRESSINKILTQFFLCGNIAFLTQSYLNDLTVFSLWKYVVSLEKTYSPMFFSAVDTVCKIKLCPVAILLQQPLAASNCSFKNQIITSASSCQFCS